jgi:predicted Zn finger-like uncharacterized protein
MSLAARCPWCETVFRLTEAQISAKGGMVRCGVCGHSFNAVDALMSDAAVASLEAAKSGRDTPLETPTEPSQIVEAPAATEQVAEPEESSRDKFREDQALAEIPSTIAEAVVPEEPRDPAPPPVPPLPPKGKTLNELRLRPAEFAEPVSELAAAAAAERPVDDEELLGPSTYHPSFLGPLDGPDVAPRRLRRALAVVFALLLGLALAAQAAYWWRGEIAAALPESRPYLVLACQRLGCSIGPEARIDQLSIESSELTAVPGSPGVFNFSALLRNHLDSPLAYPAIEVTLTDARDEAVIRRVFMPVDYLRDDRRLHVNDGLSANSEFSVKLAFSTSGVATVGYRANLFYP